MRAARIGSSGRCGDQGRVWLSDQVAPCLEGKKGGKIHGEIYHHLSLKGRTFHVTTGGAESQRAKSMRFLDIHLGRLTTTNLKSWCFGWFSGFQMGGYFMFQPFIFRNIAKSTGFDLNSWSWNVDIWQSVTVLQDVNTPTTARFYASVWVFFVYGSDHRKPTTKSMMFQKSPIHHLHISDMIYNMYPPCN